MKVWRGRGPADFKYSDVSRLNGTVVGLSTLAAPGSGSIGSSGRGPFFIFASGNAATGFGASPLGLWRREIGGGNRTDRTADV